MTSEPIRVAVVDDHPVMLEGLVERLQSGGEIRVIGAVGSAREAVGLIDWDEPDVVVLDIHLPDGNGLDLARLVRRRHQNPRFVLLTGYAQPPDDVLQRLQISASLDKTASTRQIVAAVLNAARSPLPRPADRDRGRGAAPPPAPTERLTRRQREVLTLLLTGYSNADIAKKLVVTERTAEYHVRQILHKMGAHSRVDLFTRVFGPIPAREEQ